MTVPAYCITMSSTPERHERARKLFSDLDFPVTFHVADRDPQGGIYGCWRSHLACWDKGVSEGHEIIAIFEDDVEIPSREELDRLIQDGVRTLSETSFGVVVLHGRTIPTGNESGPIVTGCAITTCAYLIHLPRLFERRQESLEPTGNHLDYEMHLNPSGPIYMKTGVFHVPPMIQPGADLGTVNDYGPALNWLFDTLGYSRFFDGLGVWIKLGQKAPRWLRRIFVRTHEVGVRWLQPIR